MTLENTPNEWAEILDKADFPHDMDTIVCAIIATSLSLMMPYVIAKWIMEMILTEDTVSEEVSQYIVEIYMPELYIAAHEVVYPEFADVISLYIKFFAVVEKFKYAF